jgi:adenosylhomocysteinase
MKEINTMKSFKVKDIDLDSAGALQTEWASRHMLVMRKIKQRFEKEKPFDNLTLGACLHVTKETAVLIDR